MFKRARAKHPTVAMAAGAVLAIAASAQADLSSYSFFRITDNGNGVNLATQLSMDVSALDSASTQASFKFFNAVGTASIITEIYFDDGSWLGGVASTSDSDNGGTGVSFSGGASSATLPGGNGAPWHFTTDYSFARTSGAGGASRGIDTAGEWFEVTFDLAGSYTYADLLDALADGTLRVGLHVQAIGTVGGSDAYLSEGGPSPQGMVPAPGGALLVVLGMSLVGFIKRRLA